MHPQPSKIFPVRRGLQAAVLAVVLFAALAAPAAMPVIEQRWLFIFDTSSGMKKRLPAVETQIQMLLTKDFASSLHAGDSIGVWTFDDRVSMGKYPLITWDPKRAPLTASNLMTFVHKQSYSGSTSFGALQPTLDTVIEDSDRLTVVIICDGEGEILWTPYNDGMNETMKQTREDRKKIKEPYIIILRTQLGKYVGATVNFPPLAANLPPFPLLPSEIKARQPPPPPVAVKLPPSAPPLVIVGTHVSSDTNDVVKYAATGQLPAAPAAAVSATDVQAGMVPVAIVTNTPAPAPGSVPVTTSASAPAVPPAAVPSAPPATPGKVPPAAAASTPAPVSVPATTPANAPTAAVTNTAATLAVVDDRDTRLLTYVGVGLLGAAIVLVIFLVTRGRSRPQSSLITSSMQGGPRPPEQK